MTRDENYLVGEVALILRHPTLKIDKTKWTAKLETEDFIKGECKIVCVLRESLRAVYETLDRFFEAFIRSKDMELIFVGQFLMPFFE